MNRRIKKKKAKQLVQKKQIELENKLRKLSQEEIEVLSRMIKQIVSDISKAFSQMFDSLFNYFKNSEVEFEEIERRRPQNVRQRTFQISKHSTDNRFEKTRIRNSKPRCSEWSQRRNKQTYRNYRNQNSG
uniref:Uncharacterized protein n=1 Tax=Siphoviridae sp. ctUJH1 TaxID=2826351 RepID=A0A8S5N7W9_9CAUD|nr:MAG TPA: hypothetical protein [Siphoviridae sp. ctUJH1]